MFERKLYRKDMIDCLICYNAACDSVCDEIKPSNLLRSIWFDNEEVAAINYPDSNPCLNCYGKCQEACINKVDIRNLLLRLNSEVKNTLEITKIDNEDRLRCHFFDFELENPFILSSSVVGSTYEMCARAFEQGWAGVAFKTICTIDIHEASPRFSAITSDNGTIIGFKNIEQLSDHSVQENMEIFRRLKQNYPHKLILASIMGQNDEEWQMLARLCEENGADGIELNFSCPNMVSNKLGSTIGQDASLVKRYTMAARKGTKLPILAKLTPNVTSMNEIALAALEGGADGIAAINTIKSVVGINEHTYISSPAVHGMSAIGGYSGNAVKPIALRFIGEMAKDERLKDIHLSAMGGVETWKDALEFLLLGASTVQATTAIMQYGYRIIDDLKSGLNYYLIEKGFDNVEQLKGLALDTLSESTDVLERDTIIFPKFHLDKCNGCGRCYISCLDGGHQAITMNDKNRPVLNGKKCVGCHLCVLVCPIRAITSSRKRISRQ